MKTKREWEAGSKNLISISSFEVTIRQNAYLEI